MVIVEMWQFPLLGEPRVVQGGLTKEPPVAVRVFFVLLVYALLVLLEDLKALLIEHGSCDFHRVSMRWGLACLKSQRHILIEVSLILLRCRFFLFGFLVCSSFSIIVLCLVLFILLWLLLSLFGIVGILSWGHIHASNEARLFNAQTCVALLSQPCLDGLMALNFGDKLGLLLTRGFQ